MKASELHGEFKLLIDDAPVALSGDFQIALVKTSPRTTYRAIYSSSSDSSGGGASTRTISGPEFRFAEARKLYGLVTAEMRDKLPAFPKKFMQSSFGMKLSSAALEERRQGLDAWLNALRLLRSELNGEAKALFATLVRQEGSVDKTDPSSQKSSTKNLLSMIEESEDSKQRAFDCLGDGHRIAALYADDDGGLIVRWNVASVGNLHELRDRILQGQLDERLSRIVKPTTAGQDGGVAVRADRSNFAMQYDCLLYTSDAADE